jgi:hypothetical protein
MVTLRIKARRRLFKLIKQSEKFIRLDYLFDELFPFFKTVKQLNRHTMQNSKFYQRFSDKKFKQEYTYVWNGIDSLDTIIRGWVPRRLIDLLYRYMKRKSKKIIKHILTKWLGKIDNLFFNYIWKKRNDDMIRWEKANGIDETLKNKNQSMSKRRNRSKAETRNKNKEHYSGKKKTSVHVLDEQLYNRIKIIFGLDRRPITGSGLEDTASSN